MGDSAQDLRILGGAFMTTGIAIALFFILTTFFGIRIGVVGVLIFVGFVLYAAGIEMDGGDS